MLQRAAGLRFETARNKAEPIDESSTCYAMLLHRATLASHHDIKCVVAGQVSAQLPQEQHHD